MNPWQQFYCFFSIRVNKFSICFATMSTMLAFFLRGVSSLLAASDFWPWPEEQGSSSSLTSVVCVTSGSSFCSGLFTLWLPSPALLWTLPSEDSLAGCSELDSLPCSSALSSSVFFSFCSSALTRRFLDGVSKIILYKFYLIINFKQEPGCNTTLMNRLHLHKSQILYKVTSTFKIKHKLKGKTILIIESFPPPPNMSLYINEETGTLLFVVFLPPLPLIRVGAFEWGGLGLWHHLLLFLVIPTHL